MRQPNREYVYVMGTPTSPIVKIGRSNNLERRLAQVQETVELPLQVLWSHPGGNEMERGLHRQFAEHRRYGEWFELGFTEGPQLVAAAVATSDWETESFTMRQLRSKDCTACGHRPDLHQEGECRLRHGWGDVSSVRCACPGYTLSRRRKRIKDPIVSSLIEGQYFEDGEVAVSVSYHVGAGARL